ncbi:MAG: GTP-binding protein HflX [Motiliproteus sp.]
MFFERPESGEIAILVHLDLAEDSQREDPKEFEELALSAGADPVAMVTGSRKRISSRYFVGQGKAEEIAGIARQHDAKLVLFNHSLSPSQERNLEALFECRVLDRTGLILDIFAQRARTYEGKLQVELAQLEHMSTRLVRGWTHLERQKGGIGLRGPGETQLETDRRLLRVRIKSILGRLDKVRKQRDQGRRQRQRAAISTVSLVGYTNAGKSSLFNQMTESRVFAADRLFATLDPTLRRIQVADIGAVVLADTVGFIRHLPHKLVEAFRATLQETVESSLLLNVIDAASPERDENVRQVELVLAEIGADTIPTLEVYNKIDLLDEACPRIDRDAAGRPQRVWLSAVTGEGVELLCQAMAELLGDEIVHQLLHLTPGEGAFRAQLYAQGAVLQEQVDEQGEFALDVRLQKRDLLQMLTRFEIDPDRFLPPPAEDLW